MALTLLPAGPSRISATDSGERLKVRGSMSAKTGRAPARRIELAVAKKLKGVVTTASGWAMERVADRAVADAGGGQRQPEGVGAAGAADGEAHGAGGCRGGLEGGDLRAEDEVLRVADPRDGVQNLLPEGSELAREVEHGNGLRNGFGHCKPWYNAGRLNPLPRQRV